MDFLTDSVFIYSSTRDHMQYRVYNGDFFSVSPLKYLLSDLKGKFCSLSTNKKADLSNFKTVEVMQSF